MFLRKASPVELPSACDEIGLTTAAQAGGSVLIKVNLAGLPVPGHPRTDAGLLRELIRHLSFRGASCAVAECAGNHLADNIQAVGLEPDMAAYNVRCIDLDQEEADAVQIADDIHYVPRCFREYSVRIALPAATKRPDMLFSNNVKLFVGAVPRRFYQTGEPTSWRPRIHVDLHRSVANVFRAVQSYAPFHYFVNGGTAANEDHGEFLLPEVLLGDDAVELDHYLIHQLFEIEEPEYLRLLIEQQGLNRAPRL